MTQRTVLVTGATSGIGRHAALFLAKRGHHVIATGRRADALEALKTEAGALRLDVLPLDVTDQASIDRALDAIEDLTMGRGVDALVNNAGYGQMGAVLDVSDADVRRQFDTNVFGLLALTRAVVPGMIALGGGRVVNISSVGGRITMPMGGIYHASKYAVEALSDAMRVELAALGVHVALVEPGGIDTGFSSTAVGSLSDVGDSSSPWADVYAYADSIAHGADGMSPDPTSVSRAIAHALESSWPRARYIAPLPYRFLLPLMEHVPTWLWDAVLVRALGFRRLVRRPTPTLAMSA